MVFLRVLANSAVPAAVYALVGVSFVLIYRTTRVLNFAQGQLVLLGGYLFFSIETGALAGHFAASVVLLVVSGLLIGAFVYLSLLRPLTGQNVFMTVMFTIILGSMIDGITGIFWGNSTRLLTTPIPNTAFRLAPGIAFTADDLIIIGLAVLVVVTVGLFIRFTPAGVRMRAAAEDARLASYRGVNVVGVATVAWAVATLIAVLCGVAFSIEATVDTSEVNLTFIGFAAILIGGMDSILGAVVGAVILAVAQSGVIQALGGDWHDVTVYALLMAALLVRPYGLFGTPEYMRL